MNPNGKVPLLRLPGDRFLAESNAMLIHIARGSKYMPEDNYFQSLVYQWLFFEQYSHEPYVAVARFLLRFDHGLEVDPVRIKMLLERGYQALGVMDEVLSRQEYIAGNRITIADIALYAYTHVAADGGFKIEDMPSLVGWMERVRQEPGHFDLKDLPV
jgi:glutathione S-transferase